jgi:hypothetical protein
LFSGEFNETFVRRSPCETMRIRHDDAVYVELFLNYGRSGERPTIELNLFVRAFSFAERLP